MLSYDPFGKLIYVDPQGVRHVGVIPVRAFPFSDREHWISLCDDSGKELTIIEDLSVLGEEDRKTLLSDLASREFVPAIEKVYGVSSQSEPCEWDVETNHGRTKFVMKNEEDIRRLGMHGASITDGQGLRFVIHDVRNLDAHSRRFVEWYL
jgi:hypothetical protein